LVHEVSSPAATQGHDEIVFPSLEEQAVFTPARPVTSGSIHLIRRGIFAILALFLMIGGMAPVVLAAPSLPVGSGIEYSQNVDWMSPEMAASLDIGMNVMVPTWIPAPFSGVAPSVSASGGYYQLYWMIPGGAPTFLYIEGTVGGSLPAGSPADLNKPLSINASVQGWDAIHDIGIPSGSDTPIYDQVWWIANGVLYTVSSSNMSGSDSLSLANSLVVLQPPVAAQPDPPTEPPYVPPVEPEPVVEQPVVEEPVYEAPVVEEPVAPEVATEPRSVDTGTVSEPNVVVVEAEAEPVTVESGEGGSVEESAQMETAGSESPGPWSPDRFDADVPSDGTSGPMPPVIGGDGTGGLYDTAVPNILFRP
jgi:hypothetical protein